MAEQGGSTEGSDETEGTAPGFDRRNLMKKGAAAVGAAGVVWAAPKIEGLSLRPDYASAGTRGPGNDTPVGGQNYTFDAAFFVGGGQNVTRDFGPGGKFNFNMQSDGANPYSLKFTKAGSTNPTCGFSLLDLNFGQNDGGNQIAKNFFSANQVTISYSANDDGQAHGVVHCT